MLRSATAVTADDGVDDAVMVVDDDSNLSSSSSLFRVQVDGDDQTVQTQDFGENEDQDHTDEQSGLLGGTADAGVTDDADGETGGQTREADSETGT